MITSWQYTVRGKGIQNVQKQEGHSKPVSWNRHNQHLITEVNDDDNEEAKDIGSEMSITKTKFRMT